MKNIEAVRLDKFLQNVGKELKEAREAKKLTQKDVAEITGLREATISNIEAGKTNFTIATVISIVTAINCSFQIRIYE